MPVGRFCSQHSGVVFQNFWRVVRRVDADGNDSEIFVINGFLDMFHIGIHHGANRWTFAEEKLYQIDFAKHIFVAYFLIVLIR
ncbi:hypothetical protein D3C86_1656430 [compost metagenome]